VAAEVDRGEPLRGELLGLARGAVDALDLDAELGELGRELVVQRAVAEAGDDARRLLAQELERLRAGLAVGEPLVDVDAQAEARRQPPHDLPAAPDRAAPD